MYMVMVKKSLNGNSLLPMYTCSRNSYLAASRVGYNMSNGMSAVNQLRQSRLAITRRDTLSRTTPPMPRLAHLPTQLLELRPARHSLSPLVPHITRPPQERTPVPEVRLGLAGRGAIALEVEQAADHDEEDAENGAEGDLRRDAGVVEEHAHQCCEEEDHAGGGNWVSGCLLVGLEGALPPEE